MSKRDDDTYFRLTPMDDAVEKALQDNKNFNERRVAPNLIDAPPLEVTYRPPSIEPPTYFRLTPEKLEEYDEQIRRLVIGSGLSDEPIPDHPYPSMAAEHMRQSREISQEMSERIGAEFRRIIERAGERYGRLPVELFGQIISGNTVTNRQKDRERMRRYPCKKCNKHEGDRESRTPYCNRCLDSSKERIVSDWLKRHEYLPKVREMRRRGADTEEWLLFIRSSLRKKT